MRGRRYIVVIVFSWLILLTLGFAITSDRPRMGQAEDMHIESLAERGADIFAQNCIVCHGLAGQGHVGPPLNVAGLKGDPREDTDLYDMLYQTVAHGRPGTANPSWLALDNDEWASYTAMPAWSQEAGGTLNEQHLRSIVHFIMMGDWASVGKYLPPPNMINDPETKRPDREAILARMPQGISISESASMRGREIFYDRACIGCHAIGGMGDTIGPDLSTVGSWPVNLSDAEWGEFLTAWITNPPAITNRAPQHWSNYEGPIGDIASLPEMPDLPPTQMPALGLSAEETEALVTYLLSLK